MIAGRTFTWRMGCLTFIVFSILWLSGAGMLAMRQRVRVDWVSHPEGSTYIVVIPNAATKVTGLGGCARADGIFVSEALTQENRQASLAYVKRNHCLEFPNASSAVQWAGWPPRFWKVTNVG